MRSKRLLHVALWEPEIPPNTGNIARTCAAIGAVLHLIGKIGFQLDERSLLRAGLDYWHLVDVRLHATFEDFEQTVNTNSIYCLSAHAQKSYTSATYQEGDVLLFGNESSGLPDSIRERYSERLLTVPMPTGSVRCLNLATTVGIVVYEALRQIRNLD